jgi:hypothetical protein
LAFGFWLLAFGFWLLALSFVAAEEIAFGLLSGLLSEGHGFSRAAEP